MPKLDLVAKFHLIRAIVHDQEMTRADADVAGYLLDRQDDHGRAYPSNETIAEITNQTVRTVQRCTERLVKRGYFRCERRGGRHLTNFYWGVPHAPIETTTQTSLNSGEAKKTKTGHAENHDTGVQKPRQRRPETMTRTSPDSISTTPFSDSNSDANASGAGAPTALIRMSDDFFVPPEWLRDGESFRRVNGAEWVDPISESVKFKEHHRGASRADWYGEWLEWMIEAEVGDDEAPPTHNEMAA